jgi:hypothetical protein
MNKAQRKKLLNYYLNQVIEHEFSHLKEQIRSKYREIEKQSCEGCILSAYSINRHWCANKEYNLEEDINIHHKILLFLLLTKQITKRDYLLLTIYLPYKP